MQGQEGGGRKRERRKEKAKREWEGGRIERERKGIEEEVGRVVKKL